MVKYISQVNGVLMMFLGKILLICWLYFEQHGKNKYKKKEHKQPSSIFKVLRYLYLNVTDPLIIPLIFIFSSYREKTHDNKEFSREKLKPRRETRITTG